MPRTVIEYKCLLISPSDVEEERNALTDLVGKWNAQIGQALGARLDLVRWESHAIPEMGGEPQSIINAQLAEESDFGIAVFWSRLGTPTQRHESGSVEEIRHLMGRGARVLVYFSKKPVPKERLDIEQYKMLEQFRDELLKEGLLGEYNDVPHLKEQLQLHLTTVVADLLAKDRPDVSQIGRPPSPILDKPDIRVKTMGGFVPTVDGVKDIISIEVQNHSPMTVFMGMVNIQLKTKGKLFFPRDLVTGEFQRRRELRPGEKFSVNLLPEIIFDKVELDELSHASLSDDIDRIYESDSDSFRELLKPLWEKYRDERA